MCGIAGVLTPGAVDVAFLDAANEVQRHRGPDGYGTWISRDGHCGFGHRRLAILDLSEAARQPMVRPDLGLTITYNGEIYNYVELRERLQGLGHRFETHSDTEVLLHAYAQWGEECLRELNGMFAFAIWDDRAKTLFCARDRFGEKPFLYALSPRCFLFASEAKALTLSESVDLAIDDGVFAAYVDDGSTWIDATERTLLRGVRQLLPAHAMKLRVSDGRVRVERSFCYWNVDVHGRHAYGVDVLERAARDLLDRLTDSVRLRLRSDVPVGSCLSGGLDSSTIVALIRRLEPGADLRTFTGRFPGDALDEGRYAKLVVDANRTRAFEVEPNAERFEREANRVYWHADFPIGGMSQFAQWCVFHLASQNGVTVLLDGQGSDEQLGGYGSSIVQAFLSELLAVRRLGAFRHERRAAATSNPAAFSWPRLALGVPAIRRIRPLLRRATQRSVLSRAEMFHADWLASARRDRPAMEDAALPSGRDALSRMLWQLSFRTMLSSLLRFGDRLSMAHSREVRLPFCDHRVAELAFALSPELLVGDGQVKRVLRAAIRGLVPDAIVSRPKQGFVPPQDKWLTGPLVPWLRSLIDSEELDGIIDRGAVRTLVNGDERARTREVSLLWDSANVLAWSRYALGTMKRQARVTPTLRSD